jgi:hypothetical protein
MTDLRIPDSELARRATRYAAELSEPFLYRHAVRTFLLADAAGQSQGVRYDRELLYLGSVLHDLGLTGKLASPERFEVAGADAARDFLIAHGLPEDRADVVWDAIALHTSVGIANRKRPEVALVALGTLMDVVGIGADRLDPAVVERVMADYPRQGFEDAILGSVAAVARANPRAAAFTWVAEVGRSQVPGFACPTFVDVLRTSPFRGQDSRPGGELR